MQCRELSSEETELVLKTGRCWVSGSDCTVKKKQLGMSAKTCILIIFNSALHFCILLENFIVPHGVGMSKKGLVRFSLPQIFLYTAEDLTKRKKRKSKQI